MFLENGNHVFGVEPNAGMRDAAAEYLAEFSNFTAVDGTSEGTTLPDASVDLGCRRTGVSLVRRRQRRGAEFERILKPGGHIVLIWNERQLDTTPFLANTNSFC